MLPLPYMLSFSLACPSATTRTDCFLCLKAKRNLEVIVLRRDQGMMKKRMSGSEGKKEPEKHNNHKELLLLGIVSHTLFRSPWQQRTNFLRRIFLANNFALWVKQMARSCSKCNLGMIKTSGIHKLSFSEMLL